jgi:Carboxypeptidase regulatory-like domain
MSKSVRIAVFFATIALAVAAGAQSGYNVVTVTNGGTITGTVKWAGPRPKPLVVPINKDTNICDPNNAKTRDLERLEISANGGVANTVVFLQNIDHGKAWDLPVSRRSLNQKECRYEPHVFLVPQGNALNMMSSDPVLHNIHMTGASSYNMAFVKTNQVSTETLSDPGVIDVQCNGGHAWMNAEILVVKHPYYAVTDENGKFTLTNVPAGQYQIVAWHEGWQVAGKENKIDVFTQGHMEHIRYSDPMTWKKSVSVTASQSAEVDFELSDKSGVDRPGM